MSNAMIELMKRVIYRRAADRLKPEDARARADHLIATYTTSGSFFYDEGEYIRIVQWICPLGNPDPISNTEYLRKDQLTASQLDYIFQHLS